MLKLLKKDYNLEENNIKENEKLKKMNKNHY